MSGYFVISLDFEMLWGLMDHDNYIEYSENIIGGVKRAIPSMLDLFEKYNIHSTWAVVGMIYNKDMEECIDRIPLRQPSYSIPKMATYYRLEDLKDKKYGQLLFAPEVIRKINSTQGQEIATHTYSHYYCMEEGQTALEFEADLLKAKEVAAKEGISIESIVFPKNQYNNEYANILARNGIKNYRGNELSFAYGSGSDEDINKWYRKGIRLLDSYFNVCGHSCYSLDELKSSDGLHNIRQSRILRAYNKKLSLLEWLKIRRIKKQMLYAAKHDKVFHLWWHPHNFGKDTERNIHNLECLLSYYKDLNRKYSFESKNMREIGELLG